MLVRIAYLFALYSVYGHAAKSTSPAILDPQVNVEKDYTLHATSIYRLKVEQAGANIKDEELKCERLE